jgi:hypothetical protein
MPHIDGVGIAHTGGGERQMDFIHCCHCGRAVLFASALNDAVKGTAQMGFCGKCNAPRCHDCAECVPVERQIENMEAGRLVLTPSAPFAAFPRNPLILPK